MADLSTTYLGYTLRNPLIVAACGLTSSPEGVRQAVDGGAGAVVLKSLFEEQLRADMSSMKDAGAEYYPEAQSFLEEMGIRGGARGYLKLIGDSKKIAGPVPVIASVNCVDSERWIDYAEQIEAAGADALELHIALFPDSPKTKAQDLEDAAVGIVKKVAARTKLPLAVKLGPYYTNPANMADRLSGAGARAVVFFNRFYRFDFNLDAMALKAGPAMSRENEYHESLRWIANTYGMVGCELVGGTGIHTGETALKFIAAGATAVQICSALYTGGGWKILPSIVRDMEKRLDALKAGSINEFRGKLSRRYTLDNGKYERLQYIKALTGIS